MNVTDIMREALDLGACSKSNAVTDWRTLAWLFFSPQGEEFCAEKNFPDINTFRLIAENVKDFNVYVDAGKLKRINDKNIAVIGDTEAELTYTDNTSVHKVYAMHGAKVNIIARNYAVVKVVNTDGDVRVNKDKTSVILK